MIRYEAELTWEPTATCYGWRWVTWRIEDGERDVVANGGANSVREYALEQALDAARKDRSVRVFSPTTGKSYNLFLGTNPGTKTREFVELDLTDDHGGPPTPDDD